MAGPHHRQGQALGGSFCFSSVDSEPVLLLGMGTQQLIKEHSSEHIPSASPGSVRCGRSCLHGTIGRQWSRTCPAHLRGLAQTPQGPWNALGPEILYKQSSRGM
eukprot:1159145-Pelagomonas_calceolata.AAC.16